jgi:hypothetical protein
LGKFPHDGLELLIDEAGSVVVDMVDDLRRVDRVTILWGGRERFGVDLDVKDDLLASVGLCLIGLKTSFAASK